MGATNSRPVSKSPSAAFGRLRIDSPKRRAPRQVKKSASAVFETTPLLYQQTRDLSAFTSTSPTTHHDISMTMTDDSFGDVSSPPVMLWIGPALICALFYALYNIFIKKGSASIHPVLGGVILQFVAAILGSCLLTVLVLTEQAKHSSNLDDDDNTGMDIAAMFPWDREGVQWAICAGVAVGGAEILSFVVSGMGVQAMQSIPIIIGGSVLIGTVLGYTVLHEMLTATGWCGVLLIAVGIGLVGIDPGGAGSVH
jgi:transporter family protein